MGAVVSCVTFQAPSITAEERVLVEKILARRVGYEITKKYTWMASDLEILSNEAIEALNHAATDDMINDALGTFVGMLTGKYLSADPMLQRDVLDLAEVLMPTVAIDPEYELVLDENLKAEIIAILTSFNDGVRIATEEE
jgi:hypothetical protein